ncbi:hypothetical protein [Halorussus pelagicus]|nr:hypothetical protein [Halorussus pelagicus]
MRNRCSEGVNVLKEVAETIEREWDTEPFVVSLIYWRDKFSGV